MAGRLCRAPMSRQRRESRAAVNLLSQSRSKNLTRLARSPPGPLFSSATWGTSTKAPRATRSAPTSARYRRGRSGLRPSRLARTPPLIAAGEVKTVPVALDIAADYQRDRVGSALPRLRQRGRLGRPELRRRLRAGRPGVVRRASTAHTPQALGRCLQPAAPPLSLARRDQRPATGPRQHPGICTRGAAPGGRRDPGLRSVGACTRLMTEGPLALCPRRARHDHAGDRRDQHGKDHGSVLTA